MKYACLALSTVMLVLTGCATTSKAPPKPVRTADKPAEVQVSIYPFDQLRYVTPGQVAGRNILSLVSIAATRIPGEFGNKQDMKGKDLGTIPAPVDTYKATLEQAIFDLIRQNPGRYAATYQEPFNFRVSDFRLKYVKMLSTQDTRYQLDYAVFGSKQPDQGKVKDTVYTSCTRTSGAFTLPQWRANDYALAKQMTQQYGQECQQELISKLPKLLAAG